mgnify:CR=1 FL=1
MQQTCSNQKRWPEKTPKYLVECEMLHNIEFFQLSLDFWAVTVPPIHFAFGVMGFQNYITTNKTYLLDLTYSLRLYGIRKRYFIVLSPSKL